MVRRVIPTRGVHIETIHPPQDYTPAQLDRGKLVLLEEPKR